MTKIRTKKVLEPEERKLILGLTKKGFLSKDQESEFALIESHLNEENFNSTKDLTKLKSLDVQVEAISDFNSNLSPSHPKGLNPTKSSMPKHP